jgi:hypothetical protein
MIRLLVTGATASLHRFRARDSSRVRGLCEQASEGANKAARQLKIPRLVQPWEYNGLPNEQEQPMIDRVRRAPAVLTFLAVAAVAGCSSSGKAGGGSTPPHSPISSPAASTTASTSAAPAGAATPSGTGTPADSGTKALVAKAYRTFFDPKAPAATTQAALQHGSSFAATLDAAANSSAAKGIAATVTAVNLINPDLAYVTFTLTNSGSALLTDTPGYAVRENGTWKVAAQTFCNLLQLQKLSPAECKDPAITALPS